jgi:peptide/nickel transport system permease protein
MTAPATGATNYVPGASRAQLRRLRIRRFFRHRMAVASAIVLLILVLASLFAPVIESILGVDVRDVDLHHILEGPSFAHPLGTDELGRDVLVRLLYGGRVSLLVGIATALFAAVIGTVIGIMAGYYGGWLDGLLMRTTDLVISLPVLPLLIVLAAVDVTAFGVPKSVAEGESISLYRFIGIIALVGWTGVARLVRGATLSVREREFVRAAHAMGASNRRVMWVHILPNVISPIIVATTLSVGGIILFESILSFLGLGIQPPLPSWGNMLTYAQELMSSAPQLMVWPGLMIFITVIAFNFFGDGLQDALDPRAVSD